ncbi:hypothetical protein LTS18_000684, partial [Coniosporium uncinatum]
MVHFIGTDKPWFKGRETRGQGGTYGELVSKWWAVYDRHYKQASQPYDPRRRYEAPSMTVQKLVFGEQTSAGYHNAPSEPVVSLSLEPRTQHQNAQPEPPREAPAVSAEPQLSDEPEPAEQFDQGLIEPTPTAQQRRFSAPHMDWDATRAAPPAESKPEARNFPVQTYDWTESKELFKQPAAYPEPPKDMWYQVPESKPKPYEPPPAIFPWERESRTRPKPTRIFAEDLPQKPEPEAPSTPTLMKTSPAGETVSVSSESTPNEEPPPVPFSPTSNAWDNDPSIDRYVRAVKDAQERRFAGKRSPVGQIPMPSAIEEILSPLVNNAKARESRRESLILTDFPSAMDRP